MIKMHLWNCSRKSAHHLTTECLATAIKKQRICLQWDCFYLRVCYGQRGALQQCADLQFFFMFKAWAESNTLHCAVSAATLEHRNRISLAYTKLCPLNYLAFRTKIQPQIQNFIREPSTSGSPVLHKQVKLYREAPSFSGEATRSPFYLL